MNSDLEKLHPYPFTRLRELLSAVSAPDGAVSDGAVSDGTAPISLAVGEPQHAPPEFIKQAMIEGLSGLNKYPATAGTPELRQAIAGWLQRRYELGNSIDPEAMVLPVVGTREALFALAQVVVDRATSKSVIAEPPLVVMPSPFYQIYEGAAIMSGAQPYYLPCLEESGLLPDYSQVSDEVWERCQLLYLCSPGNPTGAIHSLEDYKQLLALADSFDFVIASDECYSEIYPDESQPTVGLLQACQQTGRSDYRRCIVFNSLSKRSSAPGLRSGFVAGDPDLLSRFLLYRTYHGSAMPGHHQLASIAAWSDEEHVVSNRRRYAEKIHAVSEQLQPYLPHSRPQGGFCLWVQTPGDDRQFCRDLFEQTGVTILPGQFLARDIVGSEGGEGSDGSDDSYVSNAGQNRARIALVYPLEQCLEAAARIAAFVAGR